MIVSSQEVCSIFVYIGLYLLVILVLSNNRQYKMASLQQILLFQLCHLIEFKKNYVILCCYVMFKTFETWKLKFNSYFQNLLCHRIWNIWSIQIYKFVTHPLHFSCTQKRNLKMLRNNDVMTDVSYFVINYYIFYIIHDEKLII